MITVNELEPEARIRAVTNASNVDNDTEEDDIAETVRYRITSHGVDFGIARLVRRINDGDILVPDFQLNKATEAFRGL